MNLLEFSIGILVGLAFSGLWPEIPLAFRGAIKKTKYTYSVVEQNERQ